MTNDITKQIIDLYQEGLSIKDIVKRVWKSSHEIEKVLRENGLIKDEAPEKIVINKNLQEFEYLIAGAQLTKCPVCGKKFVIQDPKSEWTYKTTVYTKDGTRTLYHCGWDCYNKALNN